MSVTSITSLWSGRTTWSNLKSSFLDFRRRTSTYLTRLQPVFLAWSILCHLLYLAGIFAFTYGVWLAWHPAGFMIGGILVVLTAFVIDREQSRDPANRRARRRMNNERNYEN